MPDHEILRAYQQAAEKSRGRNQQISTAPLPCQKVCGLSHCVKSELEIAGDYSVASGLVSYYNWTPHAVEAFLQRPEISTCVKSPQNAVEIARKTFGEIFSAKK